MELINQLLCIDSVTKTIKHSHEQFYSTTYWQFRRNKIS